LEGLEVSIVNKSAVMAGAETLRYDSEYYLKRHISAELVIGSKPHKFSKFSELNLLVDGSAFYPALEPFYDTGDYPFIRVGDIKDHVDFENCIKVPFEILHGYPTLKHVKKGDIVLTKGGTIGLAGLITQDCCVTRDLIFINSSVLVENDYITLFLYLSTNFLYQQLIRSGSQSVQPHLTITLVRNIDVYQYSDLFKVKAANLYKESISKLEESKINYKQAETLLLDTLGMADFSPDTETVNIKSFKDSFAATGRLDAEYYQPKYEQVMAHITAQAHDTLNALVTIKKSIEPGSDEYSDDEQGLPFLRVADYCKFGVTPPQKKIRASFVAENKDKLDELMPKAGTILFSKDGSVGEAYCLREDASFITSGAVLHLTVRDTKKLLPDYLTLALNSKLVKMQAERDAGGSIILHWRVGEIESVVVPLVDMPTQQKIAALVQQSFTLKAESERLLAVAKHTVEMAIEQDEAAAMDYLSGHMA